MKSIIPRLALLSCLLFLAAPAALAQGTAFTYQGTLGFNGAVLNGSYDLQFSLFTASTGGSAIAGPVISSAVAVSNGVFNTLVDFGPAFTGATNWLELAVRTNGAVSFSPPLLPRQQLTPVPYAEFATATGAFTGNVSAAQLTGTIPLAQLPSVLVTNGQRGVNFTGTFSGNGAGISNVPLGAVNSGGAIVWPGNFSSPTTPGVGDANLSVAVADVNGDGKLDLIAANYGFGSGGNNTLTVLTNNGSGVFTLSSTLAGVGISPHAVIAADVNGDGSPDLIAAIDSVNALTILTNNGSGSFTLSSKPGVGRSPESVAAADIKGNGKVALISANFSDNSLTVLTNNGSGGFGSNTTLHVGSQPVFVLAADVNGDGRPDLISVNSGDDTLTVFTNNGSGGFVFNATLFVDVTPRSVTAADINGDGKMDLIAASSTGNTLTVLTNNGNGGFGFHATIVVGNYADSVTAADINGDGLPDLICANLLDGTLSILTNNGSGGFVLAATKSIGGQPSFVAAADLNGDGRPDLVCANAAGANLSVLFNIPQFSGDGSGLASLPAARLTGSVPAGSLTSIPAANLTGAVPPAALTSVPATNLTGTVADSSLSTNVALRAGGNAFSGNQTVTGKVGIGTNAPTENLTIAGVSLFNSGLRLTGNANVGVGMALENTVTGGRKFDLFVTGPQPGVAGEFAIYDETASAYRLTINPTGNVGINTGNQMENLTIAGVTNYDSGLRLTGGTVNGTGMALENTATGGRKYDLVSGGASSGEGAGAFALYDETTFNYRMVIATNGDVGFGAVSNPTFPLEVDAPAPGHVLSLNNLSGDGGVSGIKFLSANVFKSQLGYIGTNNQIGFGGGGSVILGSYNGANLRFDASTNGFEAARMFINSTNGFVGIGTTTPANPLEVNGSADFTGPVGIGVTATHGTLEINSASGDLTISGGAAIAAGTAGKPVSSIGGGTESTAIYANGAIVTSSSFQAVSDERIKNIIGRSDAARDLQTLRGIEITDYRYKDVAQHSNAAFKKVIAQQVEKVFPQAVSRNINEVPDIYKSAAVKDGWIQLATDLQKGERVKLIVDGAQPICEVLAVKPGAFRADFKPKSDKVFVYGRQVKDFRSVDYDAISMLNVSATQQLAKQLDQQSTENTALKARLEKLEARETQVAAMEQEMAALKKLVAQLSRDQQNVKQAANSVPAATGAQPSFTTASLNQ